MPMVGMCSSRCCVTVWQSIMMRRMMVRTVQRRVWLQQHTHSQDLCYYTIVVPKLGSLPGSTWCHTCSE
jgi:hypothetical protein